MDLNFLDVENAHNHRLICKKKVFEKYNLQKDFDICAKISETNL
jgi:hypothetical protein